MAQASARLEEAKKLRERDGKRAKEDAEKARKAAEEKIRRFEAEALIEKEAIEREARERCD